MEKAISIPNIQVLRQSLLKVAEFGYLPGSPLPEEEEKRDGREMFVYTYSIH